MTREELKNLDITIYKKVHTTYGGYLSGDPNVKVDDYLDTTIRDLEYESGKSLSDLSKEEVTAYLRDYIFSDTNMEFILSDYYPEIDIE